MDIEALKTEVKDLELSGYFFSSKDFFEERQARNPDAIIGVAEGDSWFDYPDPRSCDVIGCLNRDFGFNIYNESHAGDTLENMVYGTDYNKDDYTPRPSQPLMNAIYRIKQLRPKIFLFSGGGNDVADTNLEAYLNHTKSGLELFRKDYAKSVSANYIR